MPRKVALCAHVVAFPFWVFAFLQCLLCQNTKQLCLGFMLLGDKATRDAARGCAVMSYKRGCCLENDAAKDVLSTHQVQAEPTTQTSPTRTKRGRR